MAITTTRLNGTTSLNRGYTFYANITIDDTIRSDNTFLVIVNCYLVNGTNRTNSNGWTKYVRINDVDSETWTSQNIDTTGVPRNGGEVNVISKIFYVPITMSTIGIYAYLDKSNFTSYDPGTCIINGYVSMPKVASTWNSSLLSIPNVESAFTLPINKYVSEYYNVVEVRNNNNTYLVKTINDAVNGTSVTFSSSELNDIYILDNNRNQLPLRFFLDLKTYTNSSKTIQIGNTQRLTCEAYIVNGQPTAIYELEEQDEKVIELLGGSSTNKIIRNASDLLFTITATALKGATISSVKVNDTPATLSSGNYILNVNNITTDTFNIVVTDSRNLSQTYTETKTIIDYLALAYNTWSIKRESQTSSDLILNADITCYSDLINGFANTPLVQYSIDNENWVTISSSDYTFQDNKITITNLTLLNLIDYQSSGRFYLKVSDLLGDINDNKDVSVGIYTFAKSDRKVRINGTLEIADRNGQNRKNVMEEINTINSNRQFVSFAGRSDIESTDEQTVVSTTLNKGTYLVICDFVLNYYGQQGRELETRMYLNNVLCHYTVGVLNTFAFALTRPIVTIVDVSSDNSTLTLKTKSSTTARYDYGNAGLNILRLK